MKQFTLALLIVCILVIIMGLPVDVLAQGNKLDVLEIGLNDLNGGQPVGLSGLISNATLEFNIPNTRRVINPSWLSININPSQMLDSDRSSLTIGLNERQVASIQLSEFTSGVVQIDLPAEMFHQGPNTLTFTAMLHLPDDNQTTCSNWDDPSRWLEIDPDSNLHLAIKPVDLPLDLAFFPDAFVEPLDHYVAGREKNETTFIIPTSPTMDDLTNLVSIAYLFGHQAGQDFQWQPKIINEQAFDDTAVLNQGVVLLRSKFEAVNAPPQANRDFIMMRNSPWDASYPALYLSDNNPQDGFSVAQLLGDPVHRTILRTNLAYLEPSTKSSPAPFQNEYTFEQLGYFSRTVRGIGESSLVYRVYIPYDIDIEDSVLKLVISHSPDLDKDKSSILVYLNGYTVAGIIPTARSAQFDPIAVNLPADRFRPGVNFIRITFDLQLPYSSCERAPQSVWATIDASSILNTKFRRVARTPTLADYPMPYSDYPGVAFVLPDNFDQETLERIIDLAFQLGQNSQLTYRPPVVYTASNFAPESTDFENLILVGLPTENPHIFAINRLLPQPFTQDGGHLEPGYGIYLPTSEVEASVGLLETLVSPWNSNGVILVISGTDTQGLEWTWDVLLDPTYLRSFSGNVMLVGSNERLVAGEDVRTEISFYESPEVSRLPVIGKLLQKLEPSDVFPVIAAVETALLSLLGVLALLRWRDRM